MSYHGHTCTLPAMERPCGPCPACERAREADASRESRPCMAWQDSIVKVNAPFLLAAARNPGQRGYDGVPFRYCPWCASPLTSEAP